MADTPTAEKEVPITFVAPSYALFDVEQNAIITTVHGNLAIFSTKGMADVWARTSKRNLKVLSVQIQQLTEQ